MTDEQITDQSAVESQPPADELPTADAADPLGESPEEQAIEGDLSELLRHAESQRDEYLDLARRAQADFENFRKRAARETAQARERGAADLIAALLPALDNLERGLASVANESNHGATGAGATPAEGASDSGELATLVAGMQMVCADIQGVFQRVGVQAVDPVNEPFDPNVHEAVTTQQVDGVDPGQVIEVAQKGYVLNETILRPARVVVSA